MPEKQPKYLRFQGELDRFEIHQKGATFYLKEHPEAFQMPANHKFHFRVFIYLWFKLLMDQEILFIVNVKGMEIIGVDSVELELLEELLEGIYPILERLQKRDDDKDDLN